LFQIKDRDRRGDYAFSAKESAMKSTPVSPEFAARDRLSGFDLLDECHRASVIVLGKLDSLVERLGKGNADAQARSLASDVVRHFTTVMPQHHRDEERDVFPKLMGDGDPQIVQDVVRLQQDHHWLDIDWKELSPHVNAIASGMAWNDFELLREGVEIFTALLHEHMALEESVIYPEARARLLDGARLESRRLATAQRRAERARKKAGATPVAPG
jgi:hemerythrin-like domain-containing protein